MTVSLLFVARGIGDFTFCAKCERHSEVGRLEFGLFIRGKDYSCSKRVSRRPEAGRSSYQDPSLMSFQGPWPAAWPLEQNDLRALWECKPFPAESWLEQRKNS